MGEKIIAHSDFVGSDGRNYRVTVEEIEPPQEEPQPECADDMDEWQAMLSDLMRKHSHDAFESGLAMGRLIERMESK